MGNTQLPELYPGWSTVRRLGAGSFGTVYEIERNLFGRTEKSALKHIAIPQNEGDVEELYSTGYDDASVAKHYEVYLEKIVQEYSLMAEMKGHTNVVWCDDIRYQPRKDGIGWDVFIKMELLTPLLKTLGSEFCEEQVVRLGKDLCRALALCQDRNIIHRDIKPQNIFVSGAGDYKLGDFGIAKITDQTMGGTKVGTFSYMAPEVYHNRPYGSSADIYSLGLVMYWLMNEYRLPFLPMPPGVPTYEKNEKARHRRLMGEALPEPRNGSDALKKIVLKACAYDPRDRFASPREMLEVLESLETAGASDPWQANAEVHETPRLLQDADEGDETVGLFFRDKEKERLAKEQAERRAREKAEAEKRRRLQEVKKQQERQEEQNRKWAEMVERQNRLRKRDKILKIIYIILLALAAVAGLFLLIRDSGEKPMMMSDSFSGYDWNEEEQKFVPHEEPLVLGSRVPRAQIRSITFLDTLKNAPADSWDVSLARDGSVQAWVVPAGELYDLYIAGEGGVRAPQDCRLLFAGYSSVETINLNDCFDTSQATDMGGMFQFCTNLTELDLNSWDTSRVTDMNSLFWGCTKLRELKIDAWDTSRVKYMWYIFYRCNNLRGLNIGDWDTAWVTDMSGVF